MPVHAIEVEWSSYKEKLRAIRARVFIEEQGVPMDIEWDGLDEGAAHFIALNEMGIPLGTARLLPSGQIGRMAVVADHRSTGIGRKLLEAAIDCAIARGTTRVYLHAQQHAEGFYRKTGFVPTGVQMIEAGIPHLEMEMVLPIPFESSARDQGLPLVNPKGSTRDVRSDAYRTHTSEVRVSRGSHRSDQQRASNGSGPQPDVGLGAVRPC